MYKTGMILWGASRRIGNLWMVYDGPNGLIALLWDGKLNCFHPHFNTTKHDNIKSVNLQECDDITAAAHTGTPIGQFPEWARNLMVANPTPFPKPRRPGSVALSPGVISQVNKALGIIDDAPKTGHKTHVADVCRRSENGLHKYKSYTGLNETFEYCEHCDYKRSVRSS